MHTRKILMAAAVAIALLAASLSGESRVLILDYHTFLASGTSTMDYTHEELAAEMDRITSLGYHIVALEDAIAGNIEGDENIVITIDDGNHSIFSAVNDVLLPRGIKPTLFIFPAVIGREPHYLTRDQLNSLMGAGCVVGAHGYHHNYMTRRAWRKDPADVLAEARRPGPSLLLMTGLRPTYFAYPFGVAALEAEDAVKKAGYDWAFLADERFAWVNLADPTLDHWAVPRTIVYRWSRENLFKLLEARARTRN